MNKRLNSVLFILAGTVVNLVLALVSIGSFLLALGAASPFLGSTVTILAPFAVITGILVSMLLYQWLAKWALAKFDLYEKLDPLFTARYKKK